MKTERYTDPRTGITGTIINDTDVPTEDVLRSWDPMETEWDPSSVPSKALVDALVTWTTRIIGGGAGGGRRKGSLFDRDRFVCPENVFEQMRTAYEAAKDDVVSGWLRASEALAFSRVRVECADEDEEDIWDQILEDIDFEAKMREMWHELNLVSQIYIGVWWGEKTYKVRGKSDITGIQRKKSYTVTVPMGIVVLDPLRVVPAGAFLFNEPTLTYVAEPAEYDLIDSYLLSDDSSGADPIVDRLIEAKFNPDYRDRKELSNLGVDPNRLFALRKEQPAHAPVAGDVNLPIVFRHTITRPSYERWAPVKLVSIFELLDMKTQMRASDRSLLMGAGNFILLVKKGDDKHPAQQQEIDALQQRVMRLGRSAVLVGDNRLTVEIITPDRSDAVNPDKWSAITMDIQAACWGLYHSLHAGHDDSLKLARVTARGIESQRDMLKATLMKKIFMPTFAVNDNLRQMPDLTFLPNHIALDWDPSQSTFYLDLLDREIISWKSILSQVDLDVIVEAERRKLEKDKYAQFMGVPDDVKFGLPADSTAPKPGKPAGSASDPKAAGRAGGGSKAGGGSGAMGKGAGQAAQPRPKSSNTPTGASPRGIKSRPKTQSHGVPASLDEEEEDAFDDPGAD